MDCRVEEACSRRAAAILTAKSLQQGKKFFSILSSTSTGHIRYTLLVGPPFPLRVALILGNIDLTTMQTEILVYALCGCCRFVGYTWFEFHIGSTVTIKRHCAHKGTDMVSINGQKG